ncbi:MAG: hypothetical protein QXD62_00080 [Candidatus Woesearchaeota archaeon]
MEKDIQIKEDLKCVIREKLEKTGKNKLLADIFVECLFSQKPLSLNELSKATGYSISSLSLALKEKHGFLVTIKKPGDKKIYVDINTESKTNIIEELKEEYFNNLPRILTLLEKVNKRTEKITKFEKEIKKIREIIGHVLELIQNEN